MLSVESLFVITGHEKGKSLLSKRGFFHPNGDHLTLLNIYRSFACKDNNLQKWCTENSIDPRAMKHVAAVRAQLLDFCKKHSLLNTATSNNLPSNCENVEDILQSLCAGHLLQCAFKQVDGSLKTLFGRQVEWLIVLFIFNF